MFRRLRETIARRQRGLPADGDGQVLLLTAILGLFLVLAVSSIIPIGQGIEGKIQAQNAADAAAMAAATWMARGSNFLQATNGLHWDVDVLLANSICTVSILGAVAVAIEFVAMVVECLPVETCPAAIELFEKEFKITETIVNTTNLAIEGLHLLTEKAIWVAQTSVVMITPRVAFLHANEIARQNGADHLDISGLVQDDFSALRTGLGPAKSYFNTWIIQETGAGLDPYTWEVGETNLNPVGFKIPNPLGFIKLPWSIDDPGSLDFAEDTAAVEFDIDNPLDWTADMFIRNWIMPYAANIIAPFLLAGTFELIALAEGHWWDIPIPWFDDYMVSNEKVREGEPVTFVVSRDARESFILDSFFRGEGDKAVPQTYAFASARIAGPWEEYQLCAAGHSDTEFPVLYLATPIWALGWPPFPFYRAYKGEFRPELAPVKVLGKEGEDLLIQH